MRARRGCPHLWKLEEDLPSLEAERERRGFPAYSAALFSRALLVAGGSSVGRGGQDSAGGLLRKKKEQREEVSSCESP